MTIMATVMTTTATLLHLRRPITVTHTYTPRTNRLSL